MERIIQNTLSPRFFPTSQFQDNFKHKRYLQLKGLLQEISHEISTIFPSNKYEIKVKSGLGKIAGVPWIGIHSKAEGIDVSPMSGIYLTMLWRYDGSGLAVSLQKGTDNSTKKAVKETVDRLRHKHGIGDFSKTISLNAPLGSQRPANYENANVVGRDFSSGDLTALRQCLVELEVYYDDVISGRQKYLENQRKMEKEEPGYQDPRRRTTRGSETQWIRNPKLRDNAIEDAGYLCEFDSSHTSFVVGGNRFMEGHHLVPMEYQDRFPSQTLDFQENIFSLCPNCHRKIHLGETGDRIKMVNSLFNIRGREISEVVKVSLQLIESFYIDD